jgi:predicted glycoside hydrolase/deacetylase ChbG (UPF0249 family)
VSIAFDSAEKFSYVLSTDRHMENPPTFIFHYATLREHRRMVSLFDEADSSTSISEIMDKTLEGLKVILSGWKNVVKRDGSVVHFDPALLDEVITDNDLYELRTRVPAEMSLTELQKKSSILHAKSRGASVVSTATDNVLTVALPMSP